MHNVGTIVYFVTTKGEVKTYQVVKIKGLSPAEGCDILIRNQTGQIYSADSKSYYTDKEEALQNAYKVVANRIAFHEKELKEEKRVLQTIVDQLSVKGNLIRKIREFITPIDADTSDMSIESALFYFCMHWHEGQNSGKYSLLSTSSYRPGPMESFHSWEASDYAGKLIYQFLVDNKDELKFE